MVLLTGFVAVKTSRTAIVTVSFVAILQDVFQGSPHPKERLRRRLQSLVNLDHQKNHKLFIQSDTIHFLQYGNRAHCDEVS